MVEAPLELQQSLGGSGVIPADHYAACAAGVPEPTPTAGNAAGNTADLLDLSGQPSPPARLPPGFTPRGIVALVFSCVSGVVGVLVVAWYGLVGSGEEAGQGGGGGGKSSGVGAGAGGSHDDGGGSHSVASSNGEQLQHRGGGAEAQEVMMVSGGGSVRA